MPKKKSSKNSTRITTSLIILALATTTPVAVFRTIQHKLQSRPSFTIARVTQTDPHCTPGAIYKSATKQQICIPGYSLLSRNVDEKTKKEVFRDYKIIGSYGDYEVDHLISLQLGGSNDVSNLWPEAYNDSLGAKQKDKVENFLHQKVCKGEISLEQAQKEISRNWKQRNTSLQK
jgi:hypothetical protein